MHPLGILGGPGNVTLQFLVTLICGQRMIPPTKSDPQKNPLTFVGRPPGWYRLPEYRPSRAITTPSS
jgi:hypothetical protein